MKRLHAGLLSLGILLTSLAIGLILLATAPDAARIPPQPTHPTVEVLEVQPEDYTVLIHSRGTVKPRTQGALVAEVAGRILAISPHFRPGGFFDTGEVLATLDPIDYRHARTIARAELVKARLAMKEETAQAMQAKRDWNTMGLIGPPSELTLRIPQQQQAQATLEAAEARVGQAERDLARTRLLAPYPGRILEKQVDVGQYVARGAVLATLYAVDHAEVRLAIHDRQAAFLTLPANVRNDLSRSFGPPVALQAVVHGKPHTWHGHIIRTEGTIDPQTRQIYLVAQVAEPYWPSKHGGHPLTVGQFVRASIQGRLLPGVFLIPRVAVRRSEEILLLSSTNRIQRRRVQAIWRDAEQLVIQDGLKAGERVVLTPLPFAPEGMQVIPNTPDTPHATRGAQRNQTDE